MWRPKTCVMNLNIQNHYLRNSFTQQEERFNFGIYFEIYASRFDIYPKEIQS